MSDELRNDLPVSEEMEKIDQSATGAVKKRESPITFRFPRGTSGRVLAAKFNALHSLMGKKNRSLTLRECIETAWDLYYGQKTIVLMDNPGDTAIIFGGDVEPEKVDIAKHMIQLFIAKAKLESPPRILSPAKALLEIIIIGT